MFTFATVSRDEFIERDEVRDFKKGKELTWVNKPDDCGSDFQSDDVPYA